MQRLARTTERRVSELSQVSGKPKVTLGCVAPDLKWVWHPWTRPWSRKVERERVCVSVSGCVPGMSSHYVISSHFHILLRSGGEALHCVACTSCGIADSTSHRASHIHSYSSCLKADVSLPVGYTDAQLLSLEDRRSWENNNKTFRQCRLKLHQDKKNIKKTVFFPFSATSVLFTPTPTLPPAAEQSADRPENTQRPFSPPWQRCYMSALFRLEQRLHGFRTPTPTFTFLVPLETSNSWFLIYEIHVWKKKM